jgi:hypothetical protein
MRGLAVALLVMFSGSALAQDPEVAPKPKPKKLVYKKSSLPVEMTDFEAQVKVLFRVSACGSEDAIPERFGAKAIDRHCKDMRDLYASYKRAWADNAAKFISALRPADLPKTVVYPFGGGDLTTVVT